MARRLTGVVNWALSLDDDRMHALLVDTDKHVGAAAASRLLMMTNTNPLVAWVDDRLAYDSESRTCIGIKRLDDNKRIERTDSWLFANYCDWCEATNQKPLSLNAFVQNLNDLLCYQLKLPGARHESQNTGKSFTAVRIRSEVDGFELSPLRQYVRASPQHETRKGASR
jgi:putative DNA primase/helicase